MINKTLKIKLFRSAGIILLLVLSVAPVSAQQEKKSAHSTAGGETENKDTDNDKSALYGLYAEAGFEYLDNIYELSESQESLYNSNDSRDVTSGRYKDMDSLSDYIMEPKIGFKVRSGSPFGRKLQTSFWLRYNYYIKNGKCSYPEGKIKLNQSTGKHSDLIFDGEFLYGFFKKNYLSGANDANSNGNITRGERIYSPAVYDEYQATLGYDYKFIKKKDDLTVSGLSLQPLAGCRYRLYNSDFGNRNQSVAIGGLVLNSEFISRINIKTAYTYENIFCPGNEEIVLFNENEAGTDVNDDGDYSNNAPVITKIDRSCYRHTLEIEPSFEVTDYCRFLLGYKIRKTIYTTDYKTDLDHYNQKKDYREYRAGLKYDFIKELSALVEWKNVKENDSDNGTSFQNSYSAAVKYSF